MSRYLLPKGVGSFALNLVTLELSLRVVDHRFLENGFLSSSGEGSARCFFVPGMYRFERIMEDLLLICTDDIKDW